MSTISPGLVWRLSSRNIWRNPKRSLFTLLAIAVGIWSALSLSAFTRGLNQTLVLKAINNLTGHVKVMHSDYHRDPVVQHRISMPGDRELEILNSVNVKKWAARVRVPGVIMSERESYGVNIVGIDPAQEVNLSFVGEGIAQGRELKGPEDEGVLVGKKMLELLQTDIGKRIVLMSEGEAGEIADRGFRIVGVFDAELEATERVFVFTGRTVLQNMLGIGDDVSEVSMRVVDGEQDLVKTELKAALPNDDVETWETLEPLTVAMRDVQSGFLHIWNIIVVVAVGFGLVNTMFMAIFERTREFGLFRAIGMRPAMIYLQVIGESIVLLICGALLGNSIGLLTVHYFADGLDLSRFAQGLEHFGAGRIVYPILRTDDVVVSNVTIVVLAMLSTIYPAWRAARLEPVEALSKI
ncbi:MAG: ABC transporter permease [Bdellovibrionales bacterium]|nr:ABC transporter permease [Bdellovibrionales bacterium]